MDWVTVFGLMNSKLSSTKDAVDKKLEKPLNEGASGQVPVNDGHGNTVWGDVAEGTITITVNDGTLSISTN